MNDLKSNSLFKHPFIRLWSIISLFWVLGLSIIFIFSRFDPMFYDAVHHLDVSDEYTLRIPLLRYIFEPLVAFVYIIGANGMESIILVFLAYPVMGLLINKIDNTKYNRSLGNKPIVHHLKEILIWNLKFFIFLISIMGIYLGYYYLTQGFVGLANNFKKVLTIVIFLNIIGIVGKIILNLIRYRKSKWSPGPVLARLTKSNKIGSFVSRFAIFMSLCILVIGINMSLTAIRLPTYEIQTNLAPNEILFDFHVHTLESDGSLTPAQRVEWYRQQGIQGAAITDHFHSNGGLKAQEYVEENDINFTVIIGQEYTQYNPKIHLNVFGIEIPITPGDQLGPYAPNQMNISDMIQWVKVNGGYVIVNHYKSPVDVFYSYEQLRDWGVDGFEIATFADERPSEIRDFCIANNLIMIGGNDEHANQEVNIINRITLNDPSNRSVHAIFNALKNNPHEVVIIDQYADRIPWLDEEFFDLGNYFLGISLGQRASWLIWSVMLYFGGLLIIRAIISKPKQPIV